LYDLNHTYRPEWLLMRQNYLFPYLLLGDGLSASRQTLQPYISLLYPQFKYPLFWGFFRALTCFPPPPSF
jgi:hypothetical protein